MKILLVLHSDRSTPGRIGHMLGAMGHALDIRRPCLGEPLPETLDDHAGAVVFGGPMSCNDCDDYIRAETDWIGVVLKEEKPFLGVCLGAQMLAKHLGGTVGPHPDGEVQIGYYPLQATQEGSALLGAWPSMVYHWHREGHTLPSDCVRLATDGTYENQAFRFGTSAFGIQFHPEVTRLTMHRWTVSGAHRFSLKGAQHGSRHLEANLIHDAPVRDWLWRFLGVWLASGRKPHSLATAA